ncbi:MAG: hypothetical protein KDA52_01815, partial [Planctomycetaceae bacterium]|nr:hypothetical protein [Planctomycetaceae bacterium]
FPLLAVAYSYGGVGTTELLAAIGLLMLFAVQVAAVAVFCSVFCRTTGEAFISTYLVLAGMAAFDIWPMTQFATLSSGAIGIALAKARIRILMTLGASAICLLLGSLLLERRAFLPPRNLLLQLFRRLDRFYEGMNQVTGGIVLVNDGNELPEEKPIAWRETSKKSLGTVRYLFRVLTVLEVSILCVAAWVNLNTVSQRNEMSQLLFILWVVSATMLCVHASGVIASERSHQTLDPLLTTPLTGADILLQKLAGVRRLIFVLLISFASIYGFQTWFQGFDFGYALVSFASAVIFLLLIAWGALWIGLRLNSPMKAVLTSMIAVVLVCAVPLVLESLLGRISVLDELSIPQIISNVSPVRIIQGIEAEGRFRFIRDNRLFFVNRGYITYLVLSGLLLIYGLLLWLIRSNCLKNADVLLQRIPEDSNAPINPMTAKGAATSDHIPDAEQLASASV